MCMSTFLVDQGADKHGDVSKDVRDPHQTAEVHDWFRLAPHRYIGEFITTFEVRTFNRIR